LKIAIYFVVNQKLGDKHLSVSELTNKLNDGDKSIAKKVLYTMIFSNDCMNNIFNLFSSPDPCEVLSSLGVHRPFVNLFICEEKIVLTLANQKQELPLVAIFVGGMGRNE
jgi:hypothetical protein